MLSPIIISAFFAFGMYFIQRPGFFLDGLPKRLWRHFPKGLHEPLFDCGVCVSSVWGGISFLYQMLVIPRINDSVWASLAFLPVVMVAAAGILGPLDRAVKAFEKHYGYKSPKRFEDPTTKWDYLIPYMRLRTSLITSIIHNEMVVGRVVVEVGGYHSEWAKKATDLGSQYLWFNDSGYTRKFNRNWRANSGLHHNNYVLVIMGLAFDGNLRRLRDAIKDSKRTIIEYSDDGISKDQIEKLTEGLEVKLVIPEYEINAKDAPAACGAVNKRKIIMIDNTKPSAEHLLMWKINPPLEYPATATHVQGKYEGTRDEAIEKFYNDTKVDYPKIKKEEIFTLPQSQK